MAAGERHHLLNCKRGGRTGSSLVSDADLRKHSRSVEAIVSQVALSCGGRCPMKYRDVERGLPDGYPVLAQIHIDSVNWFEFERPFEDTPVIPRLSDQNRWAQSRMPMDMMVQGCASSLLQASQQWSLRAWM